jgi:hypothetical protein
MKIALVDTEKSRREKLAEMLREQHHEVFEHDGIRWISNLIGMEIQACFFHIGDSGNWDKVSDIPGISSRLFWYSGAGVRSIPAPPNVGTAVTRPISETDRVDSTLVKELLEASLAPPKPESGDRVSPALEDERTRISETRTVSNKPRLLQKEPPSVLVALGILCEGFLLAKTAEAERDGRIPRHTASKVVTREWWTQPFIPILSNLEEMVRQEWGIERPNPSVEDLVKWITGATSVLAEPLETIIPEALTALKENLI